MFKGHTNDFRKKYLYLEHEPPFELVLLEELFEIKLCQGN